MSYTSEQYSSHLERPGWTRADTDKVALVASIFPLNLNPKIPLSLLLFAEGSTSVGLLSQIVLRRNSALQDQ